MNEVKNTDQFNRHDEEEYSLPPRSTLFPSEKDWWTRWFYRSLFVIFLLLVISLLGYGMFIRN